VSFWSVFWYFISIFAFIAYLFALFSVIIDLFRDHKLNGWFKAIWVIFLIFVPFLTVLVYLIARGRGMAERNQRRGTPVGTQDSDYPASRPSANPAADIAAAKDLMDRGVITAGEFDALKNKALGGKF
jgi:hypothetical protein